jgi:hypothetical protein
VKLVHWLQSARPAVLRPRQVHVSLTSSRPRRNAIPAQFFFLLLFAAGAILISQPSSLAQGPALNSEQAAKAQSLVNAAGVVTHLTYTNTSYYTAWPQVFSALQTLGVHHIRDGYFNTAQSPSVTAEHNQLKAAGISTSYVIPYDTSISAADIEELARDSGDLDAIEAPNECDIPGQCGGGGALGISNVLSFLPMLHTAAQDLNVPLLAPAFVLPSSYSLAGILNSEVNLNNAHLYFGGRNPGSPGWGDFDPKGNSFGSFAYWLDQTAIDGPGLPTVISETGYISFPSTTMPFTVPESVTASYIPRTLLLAFKHGYDKTYFYQLLDDPTSPQGYGLLRNDFSEKPGFTALKNLFSLLSDANWTSFTPGSLSYSISGGGSNVNQLLLQKSDGSYWLALWLEESSWNPATATPVSVSPENIGIFLDSAHMTTTDYQFNSTGNVVSFNQPMNGNLTSLTLTDQVSLIKIVSR